MKKLLVLLFSILISLNSYGADINLWDSEGNWYWGHVDDGDTYLLIHSDTSNGSTSFTDTSGEVSVSANGNAQHSTTQNKVGASSIKFDGSGDYLMAGSGTDYKWMEDQGQAMTIEFWMYPTSTDSIERVMLVGTNQHYYGIIINTTSSPNTLHMGGNNGAMHATIISALDNAWHHVAYTFDASNNGKLILDGLVIDQFDRPNNAMENATMNGLTIGGWNRVGSGITGEFTGYLDEIRISKVDRYPLSAGNFSSTLGNDESGKQ
jgi:hypothetical protein